MIDKFVDNMVIHIIRNYYPNSKINEILGVKELDRKYLTRGLDSRYGTPKLSERLKISGSVVCYYNNELPEYQVYYIDGILDGEIVSYYPNGNLNAKAKFTMGIPADRMLIYSENGVLENEVVYD